MRIDSHQHFWEFDAVRDAWITDEMSVLRRNFLPPDLSPELAAGAMDACVAVQADSSEEETEFLLALAARYPFIAGVVGWVDLRSPGAARRLEHYSQFEKFRGVRHIVQAEPDDQFLLRQDFCRGIAALGQFGFTYDILIYPRQLPAAVRFAERFPDQPIVVDHLAKPLIRAGEIADWERRMRALAAHPRVFCKLSGMVTEADWRGWKPADFAPYLDVVYDAFGPERLMFGSDWPVCLLAASYRQVRELAASYVRAHGPAAEAAIFGGNAVRFYGLKAIHHGSAAHQ